MLPDGLRWLEKCLEVFKTMRADDQNNVRR